MRGRGKVDALLIEFPFGRGLKTAVCIGHLWYKYIMINRFAKEEEEKREDTKE